MQEKGKGKGILIFGVVTVIALLAVVIVLLMKIGIPNNVNTENVTSTETVAPSSETTPDAGEPGNAKNNVIDSALFLDEWEENGRKTLRYWFVFQNNAYRREKVASVTFMNSVKDKNDTAWDISKNRNGSVYAWIVEKDGMYDLYIGGNGGVSCDDAGSMFNWYENLESVSFNGCFDTSATVNMDHMFAYCKALKNVDMSGVDTSNVTDMSGMFAFCSSLEELDLSGFTTPNVERMVNMFLECRALVNLDVSGFDTSNVTDMDGMFDYAPKLTTVTSTDENILLALKNARR